ncbi:MAG: adenosylcobinamide-GDP ribazoletransferase [Dehalococcoidales bacterium]|nr:adenosylcobinamide-GDP ribazoletransferase [Dehalococcoidales bacterium]
MAFLAALEFLTIIPVPFRHKDDPTRAADSLVYFPVVGLIIGLILSVLNWLFGLFLPQAVVNGLLIVSLVIITGALHLDGFVDTCDGIAGHRSVEDRWRVMHDSRAGAFGIVGVVLLLLVKYISLNSLPESLLVLGLILMPVVSRWAMVYALFAYPYAREEGLGKTFKQGASWWRFAIATAITLMIAIGLGWPEAGLAIMLGTWAIIVIAAGYLKRKFSGLTGDTYGAINEVAEVSVLILITLLTHNLWL